MDRRDSLGTLRQARSWSRTKQVKLLLGSGVRNRHVLGGHGSRGTHSALRYHVKTRSNSFHSTLEPNTEVFSKVSRSLAQFTLVNSVSTLLNKGGITCNCPSASQDFCKH